MWAQILGQLVGTIIGVPLACAYIFFGVRYSAKLGYYFGLEWQVSALIFLGASLFAIIGSIIYFDRRQKRKWQEDWDKKFGPKAVKEEIKKEFILPERPRRSYLDEEARARSRRAMNKAFGNYLDKVDDLFPKPKE